MHCILTHDTHTHCVCVCVCVYVPFCLSPSLSLSVFLSRLLALAHALSVMVYRQRVPRSRVRGTCCNPSPPARPLCHRRRRTPGSTPAQRHGSERACVHGCRCLCACPCVSVRVCVQIRVYTYGRGNRNDMRDHVCNVQRARALARCIFACSPSTWQNW